MLGWHSVMFVGCFCRPSESLGCLKCSAFQLNHGLVIGPLNELYMICLLESYFEFMYSECSILTCVIWATMNESAAKLYDGYSKGATGTDGQSKGATGTVSELCFQDPHNFESRIDTSWKPLFLAYQIQGWPWSFEGPMVDPKSGPNGCGGESRNSIL